MTIEYLNIVDVGSVKPAGDAIVNFMILASINPKN